MMANEAAKIATGEMSLSEKLSKFCSNINELEDMASKFADFYHDLIEQPDRSTNVWSKLNASVTHSFANASLFWLYLTLNGTDLSGASGNAIKDEIGRVRKYMQEYMFLKKDAPKLNVTAANNFIRNALWDPNQPDQPLPERIRGEIGAKSNNGSTGQPQQPQQQQQLQLSSSSSSHEAGGQHQQARGQHQRAYRRGGNRAQHNRNFSNKRRRN